MVFHTGKPKSSLEWINGIEVINKLTIIKIKQNNTNKRMSDLNMKKNHTILINSQNMNILSLNFLSVKRGY